LPMRLRTEVIGALNFFDIAPGPLADDKLRVGQALADVATIGLLQQRAIHRRDVLTEQLQTALNSRVIRRCGRLAQPRCRSRGRCSGRPMARKPVSHYGSACSASHSLSTVANRSGHSTWGRCPHSANKARRPWGSRSTAAWACEAGSR